MAPGWFAVTTHETPPSSICHLAEVVARKLEGSGGRPRRHADVPTVVQHSWLDSCHAKHALFSAIAVPDDG